MGIPEEKEKMIALVLTTVGNRVAARKLARPILREKLAACATVVKGESFFRWRGKEKTDDEFLVIFKTRLSLAARLAKRLKALHPYELPEVVTLRADASADYGAWVSSETS